MTARILKFPMERVKRATKDERVRLPAGIWFSEEALIPPSHWAQFIADFVQPQQRNNMDSDFEPPKGAA